MTEGGARSVPWGMEGGTVNQAPIWVLPMLELGHAADVKRCVGHGSDTDLVRTNRLQIGQDRHRVPRDILQCNALMSTTTTTAVIDGGQ